MLILFSSLVAASKTIADSLLLRGFRKIAEDKYEHSASGTKMLDTRVSSILDIPTNFDADCILVLSPHKSRNPVPMLTIHLPGNWAAADFGGNPFTLNFTYPSKFRQLYLAMVEANKATGLNWEVCVETDHHGPTCSVPIIFIEIGSSEKEWVNGMAGDAIALAIIESLGEPEKCHVFFGVGGGHYAREFCDIMQKRGMAVGHILPKHAIDSTSESVLRQAIEKSKEPVKSIIILKDSTNKIQKEKIRKFCEINSLVCEEF